MPTEVANPGTLCVVQLDAWVDPARVIDAVAREPLPAVLDSADAHVAGPRYCVVATRPARVLAATYGQDPDPFAALATSLRDAALPAAPDLPFVPGWIGYLGYEAGRYLETLPATTRRELALPDVRLALYDTIAVGDLTAQRWTVIAADLPAHVAGPRPPAEQRAAELADVITMAPPLYVPTHHSPRTTHHSPLTTHSSPLTTHHAADVSETISRDAFLHRVRRARAYIAAGDIFQANLCHHLTAPRPDDLLGLYHRLRRLNPAHYAAYLAFDDCAVLSASPELFLSLRGRAVVTRPIKGTRPRTGIPDLDARYRRELLASEKDRAELAMIIDLERNDLGRVCEFGTVRVPAPWTLEAHPTVHHLVATVTGTLRPACDTIDLLRATFPGGSITGAPKIRAMQIIDELEPVARSVYCGAIGHIGLDGDCTLNIAIRTILADRDRLYLPVGAGIVADSVPEDEYEETLAKGAGLLAAVAAADDHPAPVRLPEFVA